MWTAQCHEMHLHNLSPFIGLHCAHSLSHCMYLKINVKAKTDWRKVANVVRMPCHVFALLLVFLLDPSAHFTNAAGPDVFPIQVINVLTVAKPKIIAPKARIQMTARGIAAGKASEVRNLGGNSKAFWVLVLAIKVVPKFSPNVKLKSACEQTAIW